MEEAVIYKVEGSTGIITLNRPEKRNALNDSVIGGIKAALLSAEKDASLRALILKGAGKDFCAGADLSSLQKIQGSTVLENLEDAGSLMEMFIQIRRTPFPVIAAVHGRALAGGCGLATACDIVLAAKGARFGYPEVAIGFVPAIVMGMLRRNTTEKKAFELITRGEQISAEEAERMGLVNRVFDDQDFEESVKAYAESFNKVSRSAVMLSKRLLYHTDGLHYSAALQAGVDTNTTARMTDDCRAGVEKFLKK